MVGGRLSRLSCLFAHLIALCLWTCLHDVEATKQNIIHKKVGDDVELSSGLSAEGVTMATWKYGDIRLADKNGVTPGNHQFQSRLEFNPANFMLTVRSLTLQDSGVFSFISEVNNKQIPTVFITLKVHDSLKPITEPPILTSSNTQFPTNGSCVVLLECKAASTVSYSITVRNQTYNDSRLQYTIRPQDGDTTFTCTVSDAVSQMSASETVTCDLTKEGPDFFLWILCGAGGIVVIIIISVVVGVCCCRRRHEGSDINELTVYADISDVVPDKTPCDQVCSLYETIANGPRIVTAGPQTVYDRIQLDRLRKPSVSPYQQVS